MKKGGIKGSLEQKKKYIMSVKGRQHMRQNNARTQKSLIVKCLKRRLRKHRLFVFGSSIPGMWCDHTGQNRGKNCWSLVAP